MMQIYLPQPVRTDCTTITPPVEACGNGVVEGTEQCDDSNTTAGDGCSATCQTEVCGNSIVDPGEFCDDGNTTAGDGCSAICEVETPAAVCGDGNQDTGEACDDGNTVDGDGCSAICEVETPAAVCGDGNQDAGEACDDGNTAAGDGCDASCQIETRPACGNGVVEGSEQCDDVNLPTATCAADCTTITAPVAACGNGIVEGSEQCDDANLPTATCAADCTTITVTVTEPLPGGGGNITIESSTGQTLSAVSAVASSSAAPAGVSFPLGVISYTTTVPNNGDTVTTRLTFPQNLPADLVLYKVDTGGVYTEMPSTAWTKVNATTLDITLTDGGPFDLDNAADGKIVDPIAPGGSNSVNSGGSNGDSDRDGIFGCTLATASAAKDPTLPLLVLLSLAFLYRRRHQQ